MADARMIFVENSGKDARTTHVSRVVISAWLAHLPGEAAKGAFRKADVGMPVASEVIVVSHHEAIVATAELRAESNTVDDSKAKLFRAFCNKVETLIKNDDPVSYFGAWVIVETATIS